jgi:hypothetical protein
MGNISFNYAIFKRLQGAYVAGINKATDYHMDPVNPLGGFCILYPHHPNGILGKIAAGNTMGLAGLAPLAPTAAASPLYSMLSAGLATPPIPDNVTVGGKMWPIMPPPEGGTQTDPLWLGFNTGTSPTLLNAFAQWIGNGTPNDSPQNGPLAQPAFSMLQPPAFAAAPTGFLFAASFANDDGRRTGDGGMPAPPPNHVPPNFWATSQIFLYDSLGQYQIPTSLDSGKEYYVCAVVGNSCPTQPAGEALITGYPINVICDAQCFNTFMSPAVPLPSLDNYDPTDPSPTTEVYFLGPQSYGVAAFRFNVDSVFANLTTALQGVNLGGALPAAWLEAGHPCVKVLVTSGEAPKYFPPMGNMPLSIDSSPLQDRHIAQHNLAPFAMAQMMIKTPMWTNFILAQAGAGMNGLVAQAPDWPADATRFYFAIPSAPYERYVAKSGLRGFEVVREGVPKPFPDAVILRQTAPGARLEIADHDPGAARRVRHGPDRFFGMALGVEADLAGLRDSRLGDIEVVHTAADGAVVGGFSLRPSAAARSPSSSALSPSRTTPA